MAALERQDAANFIKKKHFDSAWKHLHHAKKHYLLHAKKMRFSRLQTLRIDGIVHEDMANILRMEGKKNLALVNLIYSNINNINETKKWATKCTAYFNRCKFSRTSSREFFTSVRSLQGIGTDFLAVRNFVEILYRKENGATILSKKHE